MRSKDVSKVKQLAKTVSRSFFEIMIYWSGGHGNEKLERLVMDSKLGTGNNCEATPIFNH